MRFSVICQFCLLLVPPFLGNGQQSSKFETRCGWFTNPTPANIWLQDREAQWIIGTQGGYQMEGDWPWPNFKKGQWVRTNVGEYVTVARAL